MCVCVCVCVCVWCLNVCVWCLNVCVGCLNVCVEAQTGAKGGWWGRYGLQVQKLKAMSNTPAGPLWPLPKKLTGPADTPWFVLEQPPTTGGWMQDRFPAGNALGWAAVGVQPGLGPGGWVRSWRSVCWRGLAGWLAGWLAAWLGILSGGGEGCAGVHHRDICHH